MDLFWLCGDKECLHTAALAQGSFISRINDLVGFFFPWILATRLSDNRWLVCFFGGFFSGGGFFRTRGDKPSPLGKELTQETLGPA